LILATYIKPFLVLNVSSMLLTVLTNVLVTTPITVRLLRARHTLSKVFSKKHLQLYTGVVAILIESALPLTASGVIAGALLLAIASNLPPPAGYQVCLDIFYGLFYSFCVSSIAQVPGLVLSSPRLYYQALSPQLIIFRVTTRRSLTNFPFVKNGVLSGIEFARETAESALSLESCDRGLNFEDMNQEAEQDSTSGMFTPVGITPSDTNASIPFHPPKKKSRSNRL
jgi:hypothetical protein